MWKKFKKSLKKRWEGITSDQICNFTIVMSVVLVVFFTLGLITDDVYMIEVSLSHIYIILIFLLLASFKGWKEEEEAERKKEEEKKNKKREYLEKTFRERKIIEVQLVTESQYLYYEERIYKELGNLIFLHMLDFVKETTKFKIYAELSKEGIIILYIYTDKGKRQYANFPYEIFLKYFKPV